jgi:hypothetical protein
LRHPALKWRLNELQAAQIAAAPKGAPRGAVRDALTLFDENAALLQGPAPLVDALRRRDWHALFVTQRAAWTDVRLELFGHALLEKLVRLLPLPVLGVPGWWGPNEALDFYGDATVFRVAQKQTAARGPLF